MTWFTEMSHKDQNNHPSSNPSMWDSFKAALLLWPLQTEQMCVTPDGCQVSPFLWDLRARGTAATTRTHATHAPGWSATSKRKDYRHGVHRCPHWGWGTENPVSADRIKTVIHDQNVHAQTEVRVSRRGDESAFAIDKFRPRWISSSGRVTAMS